MRRAANVADRRARHVENFDNPSTGKHAWCRHAVQILVGKHHVPQELGISDALLAKRPVGVPEAADVLNKHGGDAVPCSAVHAVVVGNLDGRKVWLWLMK